MDPLPPLPDIGRPEDISRHGHLIDAALDYTGVCIVVLFVAMVAVMAWSIARHRAGRAEARYDHGSGRRALLFTLVVLGAIFVVVDVVELTRAWADVTTIFWRFPSGEDVTRVEIMAQQWAWDVRHAGPDGAFGTDDDPVALDELHVPAGRPVVIAMRSKDVVHSLYLPNARLKQDAVPGMTTRVWFVAEKPGEYELGCAQHCGPSHYKMRGRLVVHDEASWAAWQAEAAADARRRADPEDAEGRWGWAWPAAPAAEDRP